MKTNNEGVIILLDFDGTVVEHDFPRVGKSVGAEPILHRLIERGHKLILFTMRSNHNGSVVGSPEMPGEFGGNYLDDAINWFKERNIPLWGIQTNPTQNTWTNSPKPYGHLIIDDTALGIPLLINVSGGGRPYVNWGAVEEILTDRGIL